MLRVLGHLLPIFMAVIEIGATSQAGEAWVAVPMRTGAQKAAGAPAGEMGQSGFALAVARSDPSHLALGLDIGMYVSVDGGATWSVRRSGLLSNGVNSVMFDPANADVLFAAGNLHSNAAPFVSADADGIYRSIDTGMTWQRVFPAGFQRSYGQNEYFVFDAPSGGRSLSILATTDDHGLVKSVDAGTTWTVVSSAPAYGTSHALQRHAANGQLWLAASGGLWTSRDNAATWTKIAGGLPAGDVFGLALHPTNPSIVYAALGTLGIWRTSDAGARWTRISASLPAADWRRLARSTGEVLWADAHHATFYPYSTRDEGASWQATSTTRDGYYDAKWFSEGLVAHPTEKNTAFLVPEFRRTTDGGRTWTAIGAGISGSRRGGGTSSIAVNGARMMFFHLDWGSSLTTDGGDTWTWRHGPRQSFGAYSQPGGAYDPTPGSRTLISAIGDWTHQVLIKSVDDGVTWAVIDPTVRQYKYFAWHPQDPKVVYAAYAGGTRLSRDGGATWTDLSREVAAMLKANGDIVYALSVTTGTTTVFVSSNRGTDWTTLGQPFQAIARALDADPVDARRLYVAANNGVWVYDGQSWTRKAQANGLEAHRFNRLDFDVIATNPAKPGTVLAGQRANWQGVAHGVFRSTDFGQTWQNLNLNLGSELTVWALTFTAEGTAWLGSDFGNYRLKAF